MFKNKFSKIHQEFLMVISKYFPKNEISYYDDYERYTTIEWENKEDGIIKVTDDISFDLISENSDEFEYPFKNWTKTTDNQKLVNTITKFLVNGKDTHILDGTTTTKDGEICQEQKVILKGSTKYEIKYTRIKTYNIKEDYYIGFRASYIVNKLRLSLVIPEDIDATFICRGTQNEFDDIESHNKKRIEKRYKGIILPRQGYIFALREIS